ncbi:MAG TPA: hypothetical protein VF163_03295 [Micromonosporaceae bacterium]
MSNQARPVALAFDADEWNLIVTLPRRVLIAAVSAEPAEGRAAAEGIAGIEAIASGLASASPLVREVVGSIFAENHQEPADVTASGESATVQTLAACRYAAELLSQRCEAADADAYRDWLTHIAAVVTGVSQGVSGSAAVSGRVGLAESRFLYALGGVLRP